MKLYTMHNISVAQGEFLPKVVGNQTTRFIMRVCWEGGGNVRSTRQLVEETPL